MKYFLSLSSLSLLFMKCISNCTRWAKAFFIPLVPHPKLKWFRLLRCCTSNPSNQLFVLPHESFLVKALSYDFSWLLFFMKSFRSTNSSAVNNFSFHFFRLKLLLFPQKAFIPWIMLYVLKKDFFPLPHRSLVDCGGFGQTESILRERHKE